MVPNPTKNRIDMSKAGLITPIPNPNLITPIPNPK